MNKNYSNINILFDGFNTMADEFNRINNDDLLFLALESLFIAIENVEKISFEKAIKLYNKAFSLIREDKYKADIKEASSNIIEAFYCDEKKLAQIKDAFKDKKIPETSEKVINEELENRNTHRKEKLLLMVWKIVARELIYREMLRKFI